MATTSPKFSLNQQDLFRGLLMAILPPVLNILRTFATGDFNINWTEQWHLAVAACASYLLKNFFSGPSGGSSGGGGLNAVASKSVAILGALLLLSTFSMGQSMFKSLPLTPAKKPANFRAVILPTDSTPNISNGKFQGFRFAGPDITFAIPDFSIYTGLGIDWVSAVADPVTGKWDYNFTIGPRVYGGANLGVPTTQAIGAIGIRMTFFKGWLALSGIYNLTTKKAQAGIGNPAALIPGLN